MRWAGGLRLAAFAVTLTAFLAAALAIAGNATAADSATTTAYVKADYALVNAISARLPTSHAALENLLAQVRRECPGAAAGSPQDPESTQISNELIGAMVIAAGRPDLRDVRAFVATASRLRWSSGALTAAIHGYAHQLGILSRLTAPPLCADVRAWAVNGFKALPASTIHFDALFVPNWVGAGELPARLASYESTEARTIAGRAMHLEERISEFEAGAVETWGKIMNALDAWP